MEKISREYAYYRGEKCEHCGEVVPVFSLGHHKPEEEGQDSFTKCVINFYKYGNQREKNILMKRLIDLYKKRFEGDIKFDFLCIIPTHEKDTVNPNMHSFAQEFSAAIDIRYAQALRRNTSIQSQHEISTKEERLANVRGSLDVAENVSDRTILVLDNLSISGANAKEAYDALKAAGAKDVYFICFGLGSKGRDIDFDINPKFQGKASYIVREWHWPKISKAKRKAYVQARGEDL